MNTCRLYVCFFYMYIKVKGQLLNFAIFLLQRSVISFECYLRNHSLQALLAIYIPSIAIRGGSRGAVPPPPFTLIFIYMLPVTLKIPVKVKSGDVNLARDSGCS